MTTKVVAERKIFSDDISVVAEDFQRQTFDDDICRPQNRLQKSSAITFGASVMLSPNPFFFVVRMEVEYWPGIGNIATRPPLEFDIRSLRQRRSGTSLCFQ